MAPAPFPAKLTIITASSSPASYSTAPISPYCPLPTAASSTSVAPLTSPSIGQSLSLPRAIPAPKPSGPVMVFTDYAPNSTSPFHQTPNVDYAVVVSGELFLILWAGEAWSLGRERRLCRRGPSIGGGIGRGSGRGCCLLWWELLVLRRRRRGEVERGLGRGCLSVCFSRASR